MDLTEFTKIEVLSGKVQHGTKDGDEVCITWKHNYLPVSELKYYIRENHEQFESLLHIKKRNIRKFG